MPSSPLTLFFTNQVLYLSFVDRCPAASTNLLKQWNNSKPDGLEVVEDFISEDEERILVESLVWKDGDSRLKHRKVLVGSLAFKLNDK